MLHNERVADEIVLDYEPSEINHRTEKVANILKWYGLNENEIETITQNNTSKEIKIIITYTEQLYKNFGEHGFWIEPSIWEYLYEVLTEKENEHRNP